MKMKMKVIDCHFHWFPRSFFEKLQGYPGIPRARRVANGFKYTFARGARSAVFESHWFDLPQLMGALDESGYEISVVNSASVLTSDITELPAPLAIEIASAYNYEMAEAQRSGGGRFWPTVLLPLQDVDASLRILDEAVTKLGFRGANLPANVGTKGIDSPELEPFYARVAELGIPLLLHAGDNILGPSLIPMGYDGAIHASLGRMFESSVAAMQLVLSGVLDRHPVKIVHFHVGGVLPYISGRIDKNSSLPSLKKKPSSYLRQMYTDTVAPHLHSLRLGLEFYPRNQIMYGSDFPCWSVKAALEAFNAMNLSKEDQERLFLGNAAALFRIPLERTGDADAAARML